MSNQYMIALYGKPANWNKFSEAEQKSIRDKYYAWVGELSQKGQFKDGSELTAKLRDVKVVNGKATVDGPFAETKEILTGYFIIQASSIEEAAEISKGCPALTHGDWLQVYELSTQN